MKITVFTPLFNRAKYLEVLYESLENQTYKDFEWIIVDDGSTDNPCEVVNRLIQKDTIKIKFFQQKNAGKHIAINLGAQHSDAELFFTVDSDDYLTHGALETVVYHWSNVQKLPEEEKKAVIGVSGHRGYPDGGIIGGNVSYDVVDTDLLTFRFKMNVKGDKAEVYLTEVIRDNPFPKVEGESFCPEALIFYKLANDGFKLRHFNEVIYIGEYLEDGLTRNGFSMIKKNPVATLRTYSEMVDFTKVPLLIRIKYCILFWRFSFYDKRTIFAKRKLTKTWWTIFFLPIGWLFWMNDKRVNG